jgi:hypothetical protein
VKAIAALSAGYLGARDYARERVQGPDLTRRLDKTAPRVTIDRHPDVRRQLMLQKSYAEGLRAVYLYTAGWLDRDIDPALAAGMNDLLLPIVKGVGSERAQEMLVLALQTFGGSGYLQDYPMEQYLRDVKIDSLYEGTTGIQGMDFFFRKIARDGGAAFEVLANEIEEFLDAHEGEGRIKSERTAVRVALSDVRNMIATMLTWTRTSRETATEVYKTGQNTTRLLMSVGDLVIGYLLLRQASVALTALDAGPAGPADEGFYSGKVAAARFFSATVLPELAVRLQVMERTDDALMQIPDGAF